MKLNTLVSAALLILPLSTAYADNLVCKPITGNVKQLIPDNPIAGPCKIANYQKKYFPDLTFVGVQYPSAQAFTCFTSSLTAKIGGVDVIGTTYSGITSQGLLNTSNLTAATVIVFKDTKGQKLGEIATHDVIVPNSATITINGQDQTINMERLEQVDGSRMFKDGKGNITLLGDAINVDTTISGTICADD